MLVSVARKVGCSVATVTGVSLLVGVGELRAVELASMVRNSDGMGLAVSIAVSVGADVFVAVTTTNITTDVELAPFMRCAARRIPAVTKTAKTRTKPSTKVSAVARGLRFRLADMGSVCCPTAD